MRLSLAVLCDYANITREGKLNIMGIFNSISAATFPVTHPLMHLVMRLTVEPSEFGRPQKLTIVLTDEDGKRMVEANADVTAQGKGPNTADFDQVIGFNNLAFPHAGAYAFDILINNGIVHRLPLHVVKLPAGGAESQRPN